MAALIAAPLFFNYHSGTVFDPDKGAIIRSIAIIMLMAFIIRSPESPAGAGCGGIRNQKLKSWISIIAILLFASYLFSSIVGVSFHTSWWGSYARGQGTYTLMGYFTIFIITLLSLKSAEQVNRIITTVILTSIPIILYGFAQKLKLDPLIWDTDFSRRIGSTLGNPIFLGSYLVIVIPITLGTLINSGKGALRTALGAILALQLLCLWLTSSRGPFVGLMVGLFFFIILSAIIYRKKWMAYITYAGAILLVGFLILLNIPDSPLSGIKPLFGRFGQIFESKEPAARARLLIWEGVTNMVRSDTTRALVGYGPENMFIPYHKYTPPELVRSEHKIAFPDRAHNELFDTLITNGLIGALIYLILFGSIIFYAFKYLNLIPPKTQSLALIILLILGGISGVIVPYLLQGLFIYSSIGVPIGLVLGGVTYLFISLLRKTDIPNHSAQLPVGTSQISYPTYIAIFSALIGHFIETQFGIDLTASRTYFWILLAVLISTELKAKSKEPGATNEDNNSPTKFSSMPYALCLILIVLTTLAFDLFFMQYSLDTEASILKAIILLGISWVATGIFSTVLQGHIKWWSVWVSPLIGTGVFIFVLSMFLPPLVSPINTIIFFSAWLLTGIFVLAWSLPTQSGQATPPAVAHSSSIGISVITVLVGIIFIFYTNINPIRGNILYKIGSSHEKIKQWDTALWHYQEAVKRSVDNSYYYASIARVYMEKFYMERDSKKREELLTECNKYLLKSIEYKRLSPTRNANIGRFYRVWAQTAPTPDERQKRYDQSHKFYEIACALSPHNPSLMNEWGETYYEQRDLDKTIARYEASLKIDPKFSETFAHLGDIYLDKQDVAKATEYYYQAALIHKTGLEVMKEANQELLFERTNLMLIKYKPDDYLGYYNLMNFYLAKGRKQETSAMAQKVRQLRPDVPVPEW